MQQILVCRCSSILPRRPGQDLKIGYAASTQVFQASALVLGDLRVLKDPAFLSVSMTAEQWVPLLQVAERDLAGWLGEKQAAGYS